MTTTKKKNQFISTNMDIICIKMNKYIEYNEFYK